MHTKIYYFYHILSVIVTLK